MTNHETTIETIDPAQPYADIPKPTASKRASPRPAFQASHPSRKVRFSRAILQDTLARVDFSFVDLARYLGVSFSDVEGWDRGAARPGRDASDVIVSLAKLDRREAHRLLGLIKKGPSERPEIQDSHGQRKKKVRNSSSPGLGSLLPVNQDAMSEWSTPTHWATSWGVKSFISKIRLR